MLKFDWKTKSITSSNGGYQNDGLLIRDIYVRLGNGILGMHCMLYEPMVAVEKSKIGVVIIHSDDDYSTFPIGGELAKRGYRTLCGQVTNSHSTLEEKMLDIKHAVEFLKHYPGITKVVLMGHSGGATLMSAYQSVAEKGVQVYQGDNMLIKCNLKEALIPADGMMALDSNWGNGSMTLLSVDPAIVEEGNGVKLDPELDVFNPANGFNPEGSAYSDAFLKKFFAAQAERNNAIIKRALERLHALERGKGNYADDEPFIVTAAAQFAPCNKLIPQDTRLVSHTKQPYPLLHWDGSTTQEIIRCVRHARGGRSVAPSVGTAVIDTVRSYLTNRAVIAGSDYAIREDCIEGIQWENTFNCTPNNIRNISVPLLVMGMTGSYEYLAAETVYHNAASTDKSIAFVEGAGHNFDNRGCEEYGDTQKLVFDHVDQWLSVPGRFIN